MQGAGARTVWVGDVLIGNAAVGTDSYEQNRNLVLTDGTRADSVPNLEIETGDIEGAGHASATGRFDDEQLFYLMARGGREDEARRRGARLPHRDRAEDRLRRPRGAAHGRDRGLNWKGADVASVRVCDVDDLGVNEASKFVVEAFRSPS